MSNFTVDVKKWADKTNTGIDVAIRGVAMSLFRDVILDTPVDEGRLRSNWFCTKNSASTRIIAENESGIYPSDGQILFSVERVINSGKLASSYYLTNNAPYANKIEFEGHSRVKAPNGMVRKNVIRFNQILDEEVRKTK